METSHAENSGINSSCCCWQSVCASQHSHPTWILHGCPLKAYLHILAGESVAMSLLVQESQQKHGIETSHPENGDTYYLHISSQES
mmetsp:Transcript_56467/g.89663  ORF Transcript_56467/g.89663 Transcript_56467/m.89663 type:complete len:86 (+) Transcript_56467:960-1217(+)